MSRVLVHPTGCDLSTNAPKFVKNPAIMLTVEGFSDQIPDEITMSSAQQDEQINKTYTRVHEFEG